MTEYRIETDSLGEVRVPTEALYAAQTQRALENFPITGMKPMPAFIWSMALIKRAAAEVNMELGLLEPKLAAAIIQTGDEILAGQHHEHFVVDPFQAGAGTSHNMNTTRYWRIGRTRSSATLLMRARSRCIPTTMSTWRNRPTTRSRRRYGWVCFGGWTSCWGRSRALSR